ncbi:hypothetical protein Tco_0511844 [Tanacetum coccineum]
MTSGQPPLIGGPAVVDQWFSGVFDDGGRYESEVRGTIAARDLSQSLGSSRMVTCHLAIGGSGLLTAND